MDYMKMLEVPFDAKTVKELKTSISLKMVKNGLEDEDEDMLEAALSMTECRKVLVKCIRDQYPFNFSWKPVVKGKYNPILKEKAKINKEAELVLASSLMYEKGFGKKELVSIIKGCKSINHGVILHNLVDKIINDVDYGAIVYFRALSALRMLGSETEDNELERLDNYDIIRHSYCIVSAYLLMTGTIPESPSNCFYKAISPTMDSSKELEYCRLVLSLIIDEIPKYGCDLIFGKTLFNNPEVFTKRIPDYNFDMPVITTTLVTAVMRLQEELLLEGNGREAELEKEIQRKTDEVTRLQSVNSKLYQELDAVKMSLSSFEKLDKNYNETIDDLIEENTRLLERVESMSMLLSAFKRTVTEDEYETKEIEVLEEIDSVDISKFKILVICREDYKNIYDFDTYDYIKAPQRINMLLKYDLVVLAVPYIKHKHSVAVVDFCRLNKIEFMYITNLNKERVEESIRNYVRYKGLA